MYNFKREINPSLTFLHNENFRIVYHLITFNTTFLINESYTYIDLIQVTQLNRLFVNHSLKCKTKQSLKELIDLS